MSKRKWLVLACISMISLVMNSNVVKAESLNSTSDVISMQESNETLREGDFEYCILENGTCSISYKPLEEKIVKELTIPNEIAGKRVTCIERVGNFPGEQLSELVKINIPDTINNIGDYALSYLENLETISVYGNNETMQPLTINWGAFSNTKSLKNVDKKLLSNVKYIGEYAFEGSGIAELNIEGDSIEIMERAFGKMQKKLIIVGKDIIINDDAFANSTELEVISLQGVSMLSTKAFGEPKYNICYSNIKSICIVGNDYNISEHESTTKPKFPNLVELKLVGVKKIGSCAFYGSEFLQSVELGEGLKIIEGSAFADCKALKEIALPNSVELVESNAFSGCLELEKVTTFGTTFNQEKDNIMYGFWNCPKLQVLYIPKSISKIGNGICSSNSNLKEIIIPDGCVEIGDEAFQWCSSLEKVSLPNSIETIGESAFSGCKSLVYVETFGEKITNAKGEGIKDSAFSGCTKLEHIEIPSGTTKIGNGAFGSCRSLVNMIIPEGIIEVGENAFADCSLLEKISIPSTLTKVKTNWFVTSFDEMSQDIKLKDIVVSENNPYYTSDNGVLFNKEMTELLIYPPAKNDALYVIPSTVMTISENAFRNAQNLKKVEYPKSLQTIGTAAFSRSGIYINECGIGDSVVEIGNSAYGHTHIEAGSSLIIPKTVKSIGVYAFNVYAYNVKVYFNNPETIIKGALNVDHAHGHTMEWSLYGYKDSTAYDYAKTYDTKFFDIETGKQLLPVIEEVDIPKKPDKPYKITNVVNGIHVYWKEVDEATKYGLWRSDTGKDGAYKWMGNPTVPHFTDTKVESGKTYYYKVTAMNMEGKHGDKSEAIGITYVLTPDITSRVNKAAGIQLGWNKIIGANGYAIYRKSYAGTDAWVRVATISGNSTLSWTDTSVKNSNGTVYRYTIRALAGSDMKILSGCRNTGRTMVRLTSRTMSKVNKATATSAKCTWSTTVQATGYEVRFMVGDTIYKQFTIGNYKTGVKTFTGIAKGQTYKVQVRSYKKVDGIGGFYSAWSTPVYITM